ncbi:MULTISPECIES: RNA pyrophosphohydrolase [Arcobacteraceae]|jgi:putative (di)nucleoside polyphosphate hydrolase|uniref:(Di)nucleoside polyphosphate hydrolase n=7 Tax=root TaxID=1 RepID=A8EU34_ALIB4|nr:RNA pyrophosphohydrolase [Aliarcobacter butzleri]ABV67458.1 (Di)nucleoside polyphosphate hydrolase [Aliarcobacter butzleri RM4018]AGR77502.1 (di)nucleoside polyphosphate hydrolase [Aliarcobacter butzleri 7h1h]EFU69253.1 diucleoside polyphosphate hydrolase [Aliarcobacter butzleri JV22]KLD97434.1 RNA pyrophosphohydrolase [Aliarcobacter butzleri L349]KLD99351.1 RNA pyrophosphohydrolase [Aliarcobacter butzleri L348]KLE01460.1 RNA pyrophosphohydrolase [Aliarcobacter butzleri L351]KLE05144.1 RN
MTDKKEKKTINEKKNFRPNVAAIVLSAKYPHKCEIFIASRTDVENAWQFPQGGIDDGESSKEALFRELEEEIGTRDVEIIAEYPTWVSYEFPPAIAKKMYPYDGQRQKYYLVKLKKGATINIDTEIPEFSEYKFVPTENIYEYITFFKRTVYKQVIKYFKNEGYI